MAEEYTLEMFEQGTKHLCAMAEKLEIRWNPDAKDPRRLHNSYARNLITCYVAKFADVSSALIDAVRNNNFLTYALCGRSLVENVATLRYYLSHEYKPLFDKGSWSSADLQALIEIDDQHLRGSKFDWESFLLRRYEKLKQDVVERRRLKGALRVGKCIQDWAKELPEVQIVYDLFCDMVHPNIGSSFLVASVGHDGLYFTPHRGESVGRKLFDQSFPMLASITHKPFGDLLLMLMGTIWDEDQLT